MEKLPDLLSLAIAWIKRIASELVSAPGVILEWSALSIRNRLIAIGGCAIALLVFVSVIVYYINCFRARRRETPFTFVFIVLLMCATLWFARFEILRYRIPVAETVSISGQEVVVSGQYSLAPGYIMNSNHPEFMTPGWNMVDDTITWRVEKDLILQLTGLRSLSSDLSFVVTSMEHEGHPCVKLDCTQSTSSRTLMADLELYVFPGRQMAEEPWYRESGSVFRAESVFEGQTLVDFDGSVSYFGPETDYLILENEGDRVSFVATYENRIVNALCIARQMGPDLVVGVAYASVNSHSGEPSTSYDPLHYPEARDFLFEPLNNLFDGGVRLLRDPTGELAGRILPGKIVSYPVPLSDAKVFTLPCSELLEMREAHYDHATQSFTPLEIRYIGKDPYGQERVYSLLNGSSVFCNPVTDEQISMLREWGEAYQQGKGSPDAALSEWIGIPAVPYQDGWLMRVAKYDVSVFEYYYLSVPEEGAP